MMLKRMLLKMAPVVFGLTVLAAGTLFAEPRQVSKTILAKVNGAAVTSRDLDVEAAQFAAEMRLRNRPITSRNIRNLQSQLIENLIERELLYQHALKNNITVQSQWVDAALEDLTHQLGGTNALRTYLAETAQTHNQLKARLKKGLAVRRLLRREAVRAVRVSEAEMQAFYRRHPDAFERGEQVRVRHILVSVGNWNDESQRKAAWNEMHALKMKIEKGDDFAVLALEYSDCPSRVRAGDLGYLTRGQLLDPFADAAFDLAVGKISDIVATRFGYHLIQVLDRTSAASIRYKDAREKIERTLRRNKENQAVKNYVARLKRNADIQRFSKTF